MKRFNKKYNAFTIAEALIILLVLSLLSVAVVPAITKKHVKISTHGKWTCTVDNSGNHWVSTEYNGNYSDFVSVGSSCMFDPPANVNSFTIRAVAGGGAGASGESGGEEVYMDSRTAGSSVLVKTIKKDSYLRVLAVGGGGAGGGLACGEAKDYLKTDFVASDFKSVQPDNDWTWDGANQIQKIDDGRDVKNVTLERYVNGVLQTKTFTYGYVDEPLSSSEFNYKALLKNDERYTENADNTTLKWTDESFNKKDTVSIYDFKYYYLDGGIDYWKSRQICFAETNDWSFAKTYNLNGETVKGMYLKNPSKNNMICWNLPSQGGKSGSVLEETVEVSGGESIVATVGRGGKGQYFGTTPENMSVRDYDGTVLSSPMGGEGLPGTETKITIGSRLSKTANGGAGGYGRVLKYINYKNIPVKECEIVRTTAQYPNNNPACSLYNNITGPNADDIVASCNSTTNCSGRKRFYRCSGPNIKCSRATMQNEEACLAGIPERNNPDGSVTPAVSCVALYTTSCRSIGTHTGYKYEKGNCKTVVKPTYFSVPVCVSTSPADNIGDDREIEADIPGIFGTTRSIKRIWITEEVDASVGMPDTKMYEGDGYGSGGYGIGQTSSSYITLGTDSGSFVKTGRFHGYDGEDGLGYIAHISYTAGGGGQAGHYISTVMKKTGKLTMTVGKGGVGVKEGRNGNDGQNTIIRDSHGNILFELLGGKGGTAPASGAEMSEAGVVSGINGALSPFESMYNIARDVPLGGKFGSNGAYTGISPATPKWQGTTPNGSNSLSLTYGNRLLNTYGAGGGGGAASKSSYGLGGSGAAGAVIIEW